MLNAVIFDLDGVLIDSEPLMRFAFEQSYRRVIGDGTPPIESFLEHMGESLPRIMDQIGMPQSMVQPYRQICVQHIDQIVLFPQSRPFLEWMKSLGLKLALLTGKDRERTLHILDHFGLTHFFDTVVASDQLQHAKPHPQGILTCLRLMNCLPEHAVMIGDAVSDILCAQRGSVRAVAVTWGIKPERVQTPALCRPDGIVHDWRELTQFLWQEYGAPARPATSVSTMGACQFGGEI